MNINNHASIAIDYLSGPVSDDDLISAVSLVREMGVTIERQAQEIAALKWANENGVILKYVKDFGAVGDGNTDDTAAIQSCIDSFGPSQPVAETVQPVAVPESHWLDTPQASLGGKTAREGYAANPAYSIPSQPAIQAQAPAQNNPLAHTWPAEIFLQVGDCDRDEGLSYDDARQGEITWCFESIDKGDVRYVRAAEPVAQQDAIDAAAYSNARSAYVTLTNSPQRKLDDGSLAYLANGYVMSAFDAFFDAARATKEAP